jgi:hypothetical protein
VVALARTVVVRLLEVGFLLVGGSAKMFRFIEVGFLCLVLIDSIVSCPLGMVYLAFYS